MNRKLTAILTILVLSVAACSKRQPALRLVGSDTIVQLAIYLVRGYAGSHPKEPISVRGGGSGVGIAALLNGVTDVANSSRSMKKEEKAEAKKRGIKIHEEIVGLDGLAIAVHPDNPVNQISIDQLSDIYSGKITNWKDVGGADSEMLVISRENNSGTYDFFKEVVLRKGDKKAKTEFARTVTYAVSSQQEIDQVATNKKSICYLGMGWISPKVKVLAVTKDGKEYSVPSEENVISGKYVLARPLYMYFNKAQEARYKGFLAFVRSDAGRQIVRDLKFVPAALKN